jgi:hypothetical protein
MVDGGIVCAWCSKPVAPGSGRAVGTETVHIRCAARQTGLESLELQERARLAPLRAAALSGRARTLIASERGRAGAPAPSGTDRLQIWVGRVVALDLTRGRLGVGTQEFQVPPDVPLDHLSIGVSVRVLYDPAGGPHRAVEVRALSV